jgi:hypothetical protein
MNILVNMYAKSSSAPSSYPLLFGAGNSQGKAAKICFMGTDVVGTGRGQDLDHFSGKQKVTKKSELIMTFLKD